MTAWHGRPGSVTSASPSPASTGAGASTVGRGDHRGPLRLDSGRTGPDHLSLLVASLDELDAAEARLDDAGVAHGEVTALPAFGVAILSVQDPDDINLELTARLSALDPPPMR